MSDKERQQETRKGKTPKRGNKKGKGKDNSNNDTGSDEAGGSGETDVTNLEFMDLQAQQEEQQGEIQSLKLQLTEMQGQLVEARSSNDEMKGMILQLLNATKTTTDVPKENDADTIEAGCDEPEDSSSDSGMETGETDDDEELVNDKLRKRISYAFSDYQRQLDTVEPSRRNCPVNKKTHMNWMINLSKNMEAIGMGKIVHENKQKWVKFKMSKKSKRRENARLQEHVLKRVLNTYVTTGAARTALEKAVKEKGDARAQYEAVRDAHKRTGERLNRQQIDTELNAYKWRDNEMNLEKFERGLRNIVKQYDTCYDDTGRSLRRSEGEGATR